MRCSPTKPCGKGSKRKQDDLDEEEEVDQQSWVEALTQELAEEDHVVDPDYEVSSFLFFISFTAKFRDTNLLLQPSGVETDSEEYRSHNETESDLEIEKGVVVIKDLETVQFSSLLTTFLLFLIILNPIFQVTCVSCFR